MTDNRPTLTVAVACPTCGGNVWVQRKDDHPEFGHHCPDCTDGTIRQAVGCKTCEKWGANDNGMAYCRFIDDYTSHDWGCLSWAAKEDAS